MKSALKSLYNHWMQNRRFAIGVTIFLTCLVRVIPMLALTTYQFNPRKEHWAFGHEWARLAKWLLERQMFSLNGDISTVSWDPFYAFVIVPFFRVFGIYTVDAAVAILLFQIGLCAATTWVIFVLAEKCYGAFEARVAALLFACYPASIFFSIQRIGPASLMVLLIGALFLAILALQHSQQRRYAVWGGVMMGLLILTCSKTQSLLLVIPLWLWFAGNGNRVNRLASALLFVLVTCLTVLPWSIRNGVTFGTFAPSRADFSYHLWYGNNPKATGYAFTSPEAPEGVADAGTISQAAYRRMAVAWIVQHPTEFAQLTMKRMKHFWYKIDEERREQRQRLGDTIHTWGFMTILGLALIGVYWSGRYFNRVSLLLLFLAAYPLVFYLTHMSLYRYRFPIEPFLLILAARGLYGVWYGVIGRGRRGTRREATHVEPATEHQHRVPVGT